jgi:hypothetical protein
MDDKLMTKRQVCDLFGISTRTFDRWRARWRAKGLNGVEVAFSPRTVRYRPETIRRLRDEPGPYRV